MVIGRYKRRSYREDKRRVEVSYYNEVSRLRLSISSILVSNNVFAILQNCVRYRAVLLVTALVYTNSNIRSLNWMCDKEKRRAHRK